MQKRTREILALVLLGILVLVGAGAAGYYILVGHNWNVTASNIDDSIGQMDGYTVFLYEGTNLSPAQKQRLSDAQPFLDDQSRGIDETAGEDLKDDFSLGEVAASYREKGAMVFTLHAEDPDLYIEPFVVEKGSRRVGLFSVEEPLRKTRARTAVRDLERQGASIIVGVTGDSLLSRMSLKDVSIIVSSDEDEALPLDGEYIGPTFCVGTPYRGEVQAVIMSPSGVLSSKTVDSL